MENNTISFDEIAPGTIGKLIQNAEAKLVGDQKHLYEIPASSIGNQNTTLEIPSKSGVYAIWVDDELMYIGQGKILKARLRAHLLYKNEHTKSKLEKVKTESGKGKKIEISFILVEPQSMRMVIEDMLIEKLTTDNSTILPWNIHSAKNNKGKK